MALWFKNRKVMYEPLEFNKEEVNKNIHKISGAIFDTRSLAGHKAVVSLIRQLLNKAILDLAGEKEMNIDKVAYHRGKIEGFKEILSFREQFIADIKSEKAKVNKTKADHKSKRSYLKSTTGNSGIGLS